VSALYINNILPGDLSGRRKAPQVHENLL